MEKRFVFGLCSIGAGVLIFIFCSLAGNIGNIITDGFNALLVYDILCFLYEEEK